MYYLLGISLALAAMLVVNALASIAAEAFWRGLSPLLKNSKARQRSDALFALGVFPVLFAVVFAGGLLLPAYFLFEPHATDEVVSFKLAVPALISLFGFSAAFFRIFGAWRSTRRFVRTCLRSDAQEIFIENVSIPAYSIRHPFPIIAVVGVFRPRMFVARQIFDSLSPEEFRAAMAHEFGHLAASDNLKRTVLRVCRDVVVFPRLGRRIEAIWRETAETAADEYAARAGGDRTAVELASALVKIARIVPHGVKPAMPAAGAFLIAEQTESISGRVRNLLELSELETGQSRKSLNPALLWLLPAGAAFSALALLASNTELLRAFHHWIESVVELLQ